MFKNLVIEMIQRISNFRKGNREESMQIIKDQIIWKQVKHTAQGLL